LKRREGDDIRRGLGLRMSGFSERLSLRQKSFKKGADAEESRRKREDAAVQLRKQSREESLFKKRAVNDELSGASPELALQHTVAQYGSSDAAATANLSHMLDHLSQMLLGDEPVANLNASQQYRTLLSVGQNAPIQEVILQPGVVARFVHFLKDVTKPDLQFEAAWVLTNMASGTGEQTRAVVEHGALPIFVNLLQSPSGDVREQAVWALGNIAGDSPQFRDLVLQSGGLSQIIAVLSDWDAKLSMMRNATWALSNLCRGKPSPPFDWVSPAVAVFANLIHSGDVEVITDACWALSYLSDGPGDQVTSVIEAGTCRQLLELLSHASVKVQTPALRAVGTLIAQGDEAQVQVLLRSGVSVRLLRLLAHARKGIRKEACWTISNISAGNRDHIQEVINGSLVPPVIHLLRTADFDIKKECAWTLNNITLGGSPQQIDYLVQHHCLQPLIDFLGVADPKVNAVVLACLDRILQVGKTRQLELGLAENPYAGFFEQAEGLSKIEAFQEHPNEDLYQRASALLQKYFLIEEDDLDIVDAAMHPFYSTVGMSIFTVCA